MLGSGKKTATHKGFIRKVLFNSQGFPIFLVCTVLAILFVLFRMKVVELDYGINDLNKKIDQVRIDQKELNAQKSRLLSVKNLRNMAARHNLNQPRRDQIIVIPKTVETTND